LADLTRVANIEEALAYDRRAAHGDRLAKGWLEQITMAMREP
jgi:hypothetical protein